MKKSAGGLGRPAWEERSAVLFGWGTTIRGPADLGAGDSRAAGDRYRYTGAIGDRVIGIRETFGRVTGGDR